MELIYRGAKEVIRQSCIGYGSIVKRKEERLRERNVGLAKNMDVNVSF